LSGHAVHAQIHVQGANGYEIDTSLKGKHDTCEKLLPYVIQYIKPDLIVKAEALFKDIRSWRMNLEFISSVPI
jgi:hypothetical protein